MSGGGNGNAPGAGKLTGGAEDRNHHHPDGTSIAAKDAPGDGEALSEFLRGWSESGPWWPTAIPREGGGAVTRTFTDLGELADWARGLSGVKNLYFHVNDLSPDTRKKGEKGDVTRVRGLHADVDARVPDGGWPKEEPTPERLAELIAHNGAEKERIRRIAEDWEVDGRKLPFPRPTAVIDSGGGYQFFWRFEDDEEVGPEVAEALNRLIAGAMGGDMPTVDVSRVMRLPGAVNLPGEKKRWRGRTDAPTRLVWADWSRRFRVSDFPAPAVKAADGGGAPAQVTLSASLPQVSLDDLPPAVSDRTKMLIINGEDPDDPTRYPSRSEVLFAVLCALVRADVEDDTIAALILDPDHGVSAHVLEQKPSPQRYAARQIARARAEAVDPALAEMNARHAFVTYGNKGRVAFEQDGKAPRFIEKQTLLDKYANRLVVVGTDKQGGEVKMPLGKWWFQHPQRREYDHVEFLPGEDAPPDTYNLWRGPAVVPAPGDCSLYMELVRKVVAAESEEVAEYLLNWMALRLQRPGDKMETSIALRGGQGLGKSVFAERFGDLFGPHFVAVTEMKQLVGNFNAHLQHALLVFGDEVEASHNPAFIGRLKTMVTQPRIRIEPKGVDSFDAPNCFALILAANSPHIVSTDADDRRYLVLDVAETRKKDHAFFRALRAQWEGGGKEAFAHHLMSRDLSSFEHRNKPRTSADDDVAEMSFAGPERLVHDMLRSGETPPVEREGVLLTSAHDPETGQVFLNAGDVVSWARRRGRWAGDGTERAVGRLLVKLSGADKAGRETVHGLQARGSWLPPLPEARRRWCEMVGRSFDWGDGDDACWDVVKAPGGRRWDGGEPPF